MFCLCFGGNSDRLKKFIDSTKNKECNSKEDFNKLFEESRSLVFEYLKYYDKKRVEKKRSSFWYRQFIWLFGLIGLVFPIFGMAFEAERFTGIKMNYVEVGYGFIMLTAVLFTLKNFTGASKGHSRYTKTQLKLDRLISLYTLDWNNSLSSVNNNLSSEDKERLHRIIFRFLYTVYREILGETNQWDLDYHHDESIFKEHINSVNK